MDSSTERYDRFSILCALFFFKKNLSHFVIFKANLVVKSPIHFVNPNSNIKGLGELNPNLRDLLRIVKMNLAQDLGELWLLI